MRYVKEVFDPLTFDQAKHVVLTSDPANPNKFEQETNFLISVLADEKLVNDQSVVLDFGCGMGRISKGLVNKFDCNVVGVDISDRMKTFAMLYVANPKKFKTLSTIDPNTFDVCLSVLALQHAENPKQEIEKIANGVKDGGVFILLNENKRLVPSDVDKDGYVIWNDDFFDVFAETEKYFTKIKSIPYKPNTELSINIYRKHV